MCILATGYNICLFKFDLSVDGEKVDTRRINFFKGMMMGGIPNYFQPFGTMHGAWPERIETVSGLLTKIILYMEEKRLKTVSIERRSMPQRLRLTPSYILRSRAELPASYGSLELPSIDRLFLFWFRKRDYEFSPHT